MYMNIYLLWYIYLETNWCSIGLINCVKKHEYLYTYETYTLTLLDFLTVVSFTKCLFFYSYLLLSIFTENFHAKSSTDFFTEFG